MSTTHELLATSLSTAKASASVVLVLLYGYVLRARGLITPGGESNISKLGTGFLLPALLFSEIGPLATLSNLKNYWPIIPLSLLFQGIALVVGLSSRRFGMPQQYVPMFVFNNVTSLPLLLINALAAAGSLDGLLGPDDVLADVLRRGRVYILINALVGNLMRFALGPYLMQTHTPVSQLHLDPRSEDPLHEAIPKTTEAGPSIGEKLVKSVKWLGQALNPPLIGGLAAMFFGVIPFMQDQLFTSSGWLSPIAESLKNIGALYTALQMCILGAQLYSKPTSRAPPVILIWLFTYRFFLAPLISITTVIGIRTHFPGLIDEDAILFFVLALSNTGPPALTLTTIAEMAEVAPEIEGQVSRTLMVAYLITPLIALPVTAALTTIRSTS